MSQKEIRLYDDSVIKLTIKQGTEKERFGVTNIGNGGKGTYEGKNNFDLLDYDTINSVSGSLVTGELGYTRDTNRLFVGNISDELKNSQQQTLGGVLTGNKYLGYVDSRNKEVPSNETSEVRAIPRPLSGPDGILGNNSEYRSYNFATDDAKPTIKMTEDGKWARLPYYNETYDAYDGDYMYDIYRNAFILFDHNIKPSANISSSSNPEVGGKRVTPLLPRFFETDESKLTSDEKPVYNFTKDMYGDGYVLFYNVVPDGDTLTFIPKSIDKNGVYDGSIDKVQNYSYNVLKINRIPANLISTNLDKNYFTYTEGSDSVISLSSSIKTKIENATPIKIETKNTSYILVNKWDEEAQINIGAQSDIDIEWLSDLKSKIGNSLSGYISNTVSSLGYATEAYVDNAIKNNTTGTGSIIIPSGGSGSSFSTPDYAAAITNVSTTINKELLKDKFGVEDEEDDTYDYTAFILVKGTNITLKHQYTTTMTEDGSEEEKEEVVGPTTITIGAGPVLLPISCMEKDETYTIGGSSEIILFPTK